jgi:two-component system phosphate regulon sensor histidine kinase PhoR
VRADARDMALFGRDRAELPRDSERWRQAVEAILTVNEIASSDRPLHHAVQDIVDIAVELLGAEQGSIMLLEERAPTLRLVASSGPSEVPAGSRVAVGESIAGRVLATERPLLLTHVDEDHFVNFVPKARNIASSIVVPLQIQGGPIGVLNLAKSEGRRPFNDEDLRVAQLFADQAAGLIHRARLHERAERRSADLLGLVASSEGLLGTLALEELLHKVLEGGARLVGARRGFACLFDPETGTVSRGVLRALDADTVNALVDDADVKATIDAARVTALRRDATGDVVAVGLRTTRGTRGLLLVATDEEPAPDRLDVLRAFSQQCATALGAAELHEEVGRKESELSSIILGMPTPVVVVDARRRIVDLNPAAEELFGVSAAFSQGLPVAGALGHAEIEALLAAGGDIESEVEMGTPARVYRVRLADVRVPGSPSGRVLMMDDLTAERQIAQTQRDFVAMIGHELRTPLTIIKGFARTALKTIGKSTPEQQEEALTMIDSRAAQLGRLIEDLLYVSKMESREATLKLEDVDIAATVEAVAHDLIEEHPDREVVVEVAPGLTWVCDETKVSLVVRHLLENALKYSRPPERVNVRARQEDDELRVEVVDRGAGILSTDIPRIFERFRQLDSSSTREQGGTGVGLYLCAQLIRIHGGRIWVDSTWGKGSTFTIAIPRRARTSVVSMATRPVGHAVS